MTRPTEMQITYLNELLDSYEARHEGSAISTRKQINSELAAGTLTELGAVNFIKDLRWAMRK